MPTTLRKRNRRSARIVGEPADHYIDLFWARLRPYFSTVAPASTLEYTLMLRNNLGHRGTYGARLLPPEGWAADADPRLVELDPGEVAELSLPITAPSESDGSRVLVTAEIFINGRSQGPLAEALVSLDHSPSDD